MLSDIFKANNSSNRTRWRTFAGQQFAVTCSCNFWIFCMHSGITSSVRANLIKLSKNNWWVFLLVISPQCNPLSLVQTSSQTHAMDRPLLWTDQTVLFESVIYGFRRTHKLFECWSFAAAWSFVITSHFYVLFFQNTLLLIK